ALFAMLGFVCIIRGINKTGSDKDYTKLKVAIVGDAEDPYMNFGLDAIKEMDSIRFVLDIVSMEEIEASEALKKGEADIVVRIPENFAKSVIYGENTEKVFIEYSEDYSGDGLVGYAVEEMGKLVTGLLVNSQRPIFAMQNIIYGNVSDEQFEKLTDRYNLMLIRHALNRMAFLKKEAVDAKSIDLMHYYMASGIILAILMCGIFTAPFHVRKNTELLKILRAKGMGTGISILCEYGALFLVYFAGSLPVFAGAVFIGKKDITAVNFAFLTLSFILGIMVLEALGFLIYEIFGGFVPSMIAQITLITVISYLSGLFYPESFLPLLVIRIMKKLPVGQAFLGVKEGFSNSFSWGNLILLVWVMILMIAACFLRERKLQKGESV
nr:ABC transporter permease [Lachnospiraceae bacterium]